MNDARKAVREVETIARKAGRELDGHTVSDDIGNAADDTRKRLANLGDDAHEAIDDLGNEVDRRLDHDRETHQHGWDPDRDRDRAWQDR